MRSFYTVSIKRSILAGLLTGLIVAGLMTLLDWSRNPGGVFRSASGTNWQMVWDTASSWFLPVLGWVAALTFLAQLAYRFSRKG